MSYGEFHKEVIWLQYPCVICCICGANDVSKWGVPISMDTGLVVANSFDGDWAGKPVCRECFVAHESGAFIDHDPRY